MLENIGYILAGLGLFFAGLKFISMNLRKLTGRQVRRMIARLSDNSYIGGLVGFTAGAVTQSSSGITFIILSLVKSGLIKVRNSLPILTWSNVGNSLIVLLVVLDIRVAILFLIGLSTLSYAFDRGKKFSTIIGVFMGIGFLFYGLYLIGLGTEPLAKMKWFYDLLLFTQDSFLLAFLVGALLSFVAQSSAAVSIIAITFAASGIFSIEQTMMIIYGSNFGSALTTYLFSSGMKGTSRQIAIAQFIFDCVGALVFVPLFYLEINFNIPLMRHFVSLLSSSIQGQMALVFLIYQLVISIVLSIFIRSFHKFLVKSCPQTLEEELSKPKFISDNALLDPDSAIELIHHEQLRLLRRFPNYIDKARTEPVFNQRIEIDALHNAFSSVSNEIQLFMTELVNKELSLKMSERLLNIQNRFRLLVGLEDSLLELVKQINNSRDYDPTRELMDSFVESIDIIFITLIDAYDTMSKEDYEILKVLTSGKNEMMEKIRENILSQNSQISSQNRVALFNITNLFEIIGYMIRNLIDLLNVKE